MKQKINGQCLSVRKLDTDPPPAESGRPASQPFLDYFFVREGEAREGGAKLFFFAVAPRSLPPPLDPFCCSTCAPKQARHTNAQEEEKKVSHSSS